MLCFCYLNASAETQPLKVAKKPGLFQEFFQKAKKIGTSYKTQLELKYYEELLKKKPNDVEVLKAYGKYLKDHGYYDKAITIYSKLFRLTKKKEYQEEVNGIKSTQKYNKQNKIFLDYINQAKIYESKGKIPEANKYYLKAQKVLPKRFESMFGLAKTYGWLGKSKLANNYYKELLKMAPDNPDLIAAYNKFLKENKPIQAYKNMPVQKIKKIPFKIYKIQKQITIRPSIKPSLKLPAKVPEGKSKLFDEYIKQAQAYESEGKASEANEYYLKAQKIDSTRYEAKFGLAKTYGWLHNDKLALKYYKELLKQTPDNVDLLEAYTNYLKDTKDYSQAIEIYQKLLTQTNDEKYNANIAEVYFLQQDYKTAMNIYQSIYNKDPANPQIQKAIALLYFVTGDFDTSIKFYEKYLAQKQDQESILNYAKSLFYTKKFKLQRKF